MSTTMKPMGDSATSLPSRVGDALDNLVEGIGIFDRDLRLTYCNRPFRELRDYPESVCRIGAHISELYRHNAERGDYGKVDIDAEVARRAGLAASATGHELDQHLPDGTTLHVRYAQLADGGLLFTYEDVTEHRRTEGALRESQERHARVAAATTEGIYEWDIENERFYGSPRLKELFGFDSTEIEPSQWDWNARVYPEDFDRYRQALAAHLKDQDVKYECEYRIRDKAGEFIWILDRGVVSDRDAEGRATRFIGAIVDISDRKRAEAARRESEARYALAIEAVGEGVYEWNIATGEVYYSDAVRDVLGFSPEQLRTNEDWLDRVHPDDVERFRAEIVAHLKGETDRFECEYRYRRPDDSWGWARQHGLASRDEAGRAVRMIGATGDITEIKRQEAELHAARARLEDAIEALSEGFVLYDSEDRIVTCNSVFQRYFSEMEDMVHPGVAFEDIILTAARRGLFPDAVGRVDEWYAELQKKRGRAGARERPMRGGIWLLIHDQRTSDGGTVSVFTDITDFKRRQAELEEAKEQAERALDDLKLAQRSLVQAEKMASLGQLTAGVAHEIKNPLNFINNFSKTSVELLDELTETLASAEQTLSGEMREEISALIEDLKSDLDTIREHGERADGIVNGMLMHSRSDADVRRPIEVNALLEESLNLAYHGQRATTSGFNVTMERQLDPSTGIADLVPQEMTRVFVNLLGNSFYAIHQRATSEREKGYEPTVTVITSPLDDDRIEIRIRDNGTGIPEEKLESLFTPFFTTKPPGEGTGLGLSISRDIVVEQHGGEIRADSREGEYTEFIIELPRNRDASPAQIEGT